MGDQNEEEREEQREKEQEVEGEEGMDETIDIPASLVEKIDKSVGMELKGKSTDKVLGYCLLPLPTIKNPIFISIGHQLSLHTAVILTIACCFYRVPEPIRQADLRSREVIRNWSLLSVSSSSSSNNNNNP